MITPHEIIRSSRKTLTISIDPFGRLIVRAPMRCEQKRIDDFLREKEAWILRKQAERQGAGIQLPPENLDGYEFLILGNRCKIVCIDEDKIGFNKARGLVYLPKKNTRKRLVEWLKENALRIFTKVTSQRAAQMGVSFQAVKINSARGSWGLCTADNVIKYSYRLLFAPKDVVEYVIVHELAHVTHKNHSARFWSEVAKYVPDYKTKRAWLKKYSAVMEIF